MDRWRIALLSLIFLTIETVGFQTGPLLTQIGIDYGLVGKEPHLDVVIACGVDLPRHRPAHGARRAGPESATPASSPPR